MAEEQKYVDSYFFLMSYKNLLSSENIAWLCAFEVFDYNFYNFFISHHFLGHVQDNKSDEKCIK